MKLKTRFLIFFKKNIIPFAPLPGVIKKFLSNNPDTLITVGYMTNSDMEFIKKYKFNIAILNDYFNLSSYDYYDKKCSNDFDSFAYEDKMLSEAGFLQYISSNSKIEPIIQSFFKTGGLSARCPFCGKAVFSDKSFPYYDHTYDLTTFFLFSCCTDFYIIYTFPNQSRCAIYIPSLKLVISLLGCMDNDIRAQYYGIKRFNQMVYNLQNAMLRHMPSVVKYLKNTKKLRAIASGFTNNIGHQVINELNGLDLVAKEPAAECIFLWGDQDKFDSPKLFPELPWHGYEAGNIVPLPAQGGNESKRFSPETLFKAAMHHSLTVMRVGSSSPFGNSLGRRVVEFARKLKSPGLEEQMHAASLCWPMVMITLRGHTRCWVSELQGVPQVVLALKEQYPGLGVLYDGAPVEKPREEAIRKVVGTEIPQFSTIGGSLYDTICWAARIDFFISPHGAGSIFTSIANKPGVLHSHENWYLADLPYANPREDYAKSTFVLGKIVSPTNNVFTEQYELDWKVLVEKSFNIISELPSPDGK